MTQPTPKKILMIIGLFHPFIGGAERECQNLAKKLISLQHSATVLTAYHDGLPPFEIIDGIPVYRKIRGWHFFEFTYMLSVLMLLWKHRKDYDHILCFGMYLYTAPAVLFGFCRGKKVLLRLECGGDYGDFQRISLLKFKNFIIWSSKWAHRILAISAEIEHELLSNGFPQNKIMRIPNSVDTERFTPVLNAEIPDLPCISFIGRLDRQKGIDLLLLALKNLFDKAIPFKAFIVGDGPIKQELMQLAEPLLISGVISFSGLQQDTVSFYGQTDILVLPSRNEGLPLVLLEGMASGLAIIASSVGGMPEAIDPQNTRDRHADYAVCENGILVPPENAVLLAEAIKHLLSSPALRKRLGAKARDHITKTHSLDMVVRNYLNILN